MAGILWPERYMIYSVNLDTGAVALSRRNPPTAHVHRAFVAPTMPNYRSCSDKMVAGHGDLIGISYSYDVRPGHSGDHSLVGCLHEAATKNGFENLIWVCLPDEEPGNAICLEAGAFFYSRGIAYHLCLHPTDGQPKFSQSFYHPQEKRPQASNTESSKDSSKKSGAAADQKSGKDCGKATQQ